MILVLLWITVVLSTVAWIFWLRVALRWRRTALRWEHTAGRWERLAKGGTVDFQASLEELEELERSRPWQRLD